MCEYIVNLWGKIYTVEGKSSKDALYKALEEHGIKTINIKVSKSKTKENKKSLTAAVTNCDTNEVEIYFVQLN